MSPAEIDPEIGSGGTREQSRPDVGPETTEFDSHLVGCTLLLIDGIVFLWVVVSSVVETLVRLCS